MGETDGDALGGFLQDGLLFLLEPALCPAGLLGGCAQVFGGGLLAADLDDRGVDNRLVFPFFVVIVSGSCGLAGAQASQAAAVLLALGADDLGVGVIGDHLHARRIAQAQVGALAGQDGLQCAIRDAVVESGVLVRLGILIVMRRNAAFDICTPEDGQAVAIQLAMVALQVQAEVAVLVAQLAVPAERGAHVRDQPWPDPCHNPDTNC